MSIDINHKIKLFTIEPCPEKWGWKVPPAEDISIYFEVREYGYICIIFHPQLPAAYLHAMPYENSLPDIRNIVLICDQLETMLFNLGVELFICSYEDEPDKKIKKLITKYLYFTPISKNVYVKLLKE